eukprot:TRINITY_DN11469_c0_g1_i2.p1 TRINITY_DN11469_c0_g1~~TRINITY_DN11469_c0_g1_i2.p1  ORF type:complete len:123 (+),score=12.35 TRINITY_DN11469_c0_g1_i2:64-432(+)
MCIRDRCLCCYRSQWSTLSTTNTLAALGSSMAFSSFSLALIVKAPLTPTVVTCIGSDHPTTHTPALPNPFTLKLSFVSAPKSINFDLCFFIAVSYTHLRAHETSLHLVCRLLLEKKKIYSEK